MKKIAFFLLMMLFMGTTMLHAQTKMISGKVTSAEDDMSIPGVSVAVKGTTIGTITNIDGEYELMVPEDASTLIFSFVGMKNTEVIFGSSTTVDVAMEPDVIGVEEVVVTAVGIQRQTKALGYSVSNLQADELTRAPRTDLVNSITGKVAGVSVNSSSGAAGASSYITIRGAASITGNNQPLFVVDGVPIQSGGGGGGVAGVATSKRTIDINPEDIESMTVLKGGAATALYGVRAANGVIIITSKSGKSQRGIKVGVSSSVTLSQISQVPDLNDQYAQGWDDWIEGYFASWGPKITDQTYARPDEWANAPYMWNPDGWIVPKDDPNATGEPVKVFDRYEFFQTGIKYNNNVNITGGDDKTSYYFSLGNLTEEGVIPNNKFMKTNVKLNMDTKLHRKLALSVGANYIKSGGDRIQQGSNTSGVMLGLLRTPPTFNNAAGWKFPDGTQRNYRNGGGYDNPYWTANENLYSDDVDRFIGHAALNYTPTEWLNISYRVGTDFYTTQVKDYFAIGSRTQPSGSNWETNNYNQIFNSDLLITATKQMGDFRLEGTLGHNLFQTYGHGVNGYANGLEIPEFYQLSNTAVQTTGSWTSKWRTAAIFGDIKVDYKDMLFLNVTGRNDWSTTMPEENLSSFYPSASLGFVFTELGIFEDQSVLSFGKLRGSYAITANIAGAYNTLTYYTQAGTGDGWTSGNDFPFLGYSGFTLSNGMGNNNLKHENMASFEIGADLRFFENRLGLDVAYFNNQNTDLLLSVPIASETGFTSSYQNAASMESVGWEIMLSATPVRTGDFEWNILANWTKMENNVLELAPGVENIFLGGFTDPQIRAVAGQPYRSVYGFDWYRDDAGNTVINDDPDDSYPDGFPMGNYVMQPLGQVNPDWTAAITNTFTYKGLSLTALIDIREGGLMWNGTKGALYYFGAHADTETREATDLFVWDGVKGHLDADGNVVSSGQANDQEVVKDVSWYLLGEGSGFTGPAIDFIESTSWVRLREVSLAYSLPKKLLANTFLDNVDVYFTGVNLWLKTDYTGIDPETNLQGSSNAQGMDYFNMPGTKSYTFGLRLNF